MLLLVLSRLPGSGSVGVWMLAELPLANPNPDAFSRPLALLKRLGQPGGGDATVSQSGVETSKMRSVTEPPVSSAGMAGEPGALFSNAIN